MNFLKCVPKCQTNDTELEPEIEKKLQKWQKHIFEKKFQTFWKQEALMEGRIELC